MHFIISTYITNYTIQFEINFINNLNIKNLHIVRNDSVAEFYNKEHINKIKEDANFSFPHK